MRDYPIHTDEQRMAQGEGFAPLTHPFDVQDKDERDGLLRVVRDMERAEGDIEWRVVPANEEKTLVEVWRKGMK